MLRLKWQQDECLTPTSCEDSTGCGRIKAGTSVRPGCNVYRQLTQPSQDLK
jgi:hypothetical protein